MEFIFFQIVAQLTKFKVYFRPALIQFYNNTNKISKT